MRAIRKNLEHIPESIRLPDIGMFSDEGGRLNAEGTASRRRELLAAGCYLSSDHYDAGYKQPDVRAALDALYHGKCAYCEQKAEELHIEHYRPKSRYHWLAYSWDNLLLVCVKCNRFKGEKFATSGETLNPPDPHIVVQDIHVLGAAYDEAEQPALVNPEREENPSGSLVFDMLGGVSSGDTRYAHTIEKCRLSRKYLCDGRRFVLDELRHELQAVHWGMAKLEAPAREQALFVKLQEFIQKAHDPRSEFTAFRKFVVQKWLMQIAQETK